MASVLCVHRSPTPTGYIIEKNQKIDTFLLIRSASLVRESIQSNAQQGLNKTHMGARLITLYAHAHTHPLKYILPTTNHPNTILYLLSVEVEHLLWIIDVSFPAPSSSVTEHTTHPLTEALMGQIWVNLFPQNSHVQVKERARKERAGSVLRRGVTST